MSIFTTPDTANAEDNARKMKEQVEAEREAADEAAQEQMAELARRATKKDDTNQPAELITDSDLSFLNIGKNDK